MKAYFHEISAEESDMCDEFEQKETVKHFVLDCKNMERIEKRVEGSSQGWGSIRRYATLVGRMAKTKRPHGGWIGEEASTWKPDSEVVRLPLILR